MDKYIKISHFSKVSEYHQKIIEWYESNPKEWRPNLEKQLQKSSNGKIRAFQNFYNSPQEVYQGWINTLGLREFDMTSMYPDLLEKSKSLNNNQYLYIFNCNDVTADGQALRSDTVLSFDDVVQPEN